MLILLGCARGLGAEVVPRSSRPWVCGAKEALESVSLIQKSGPQIHTDTIGDQRTTAKHNQNHYVKIDVIRPESRLGLDTKVTVRTDFSYRSKRSTTLHFGLGHVDRVDVKLEAPGGQTTVFTGLDVDRSHHLVLK